MFDIKITEYIKERHSIYCEMMEEIRKYDDIIIFGLKEEFTKIYGDCEIYAPDVFLGYICYYAPNNINFDEEKIILDVYVYNTVDAKTVLVNDVYRHNLKAIHIGKDEDNDSDIYIVAITGEGFGICLPIGYHDDDDFN